MQLRMYGGHIRNWESLCAQLGVDRELPRRQREEAVLLAAYRRWRERMPAHLNGMFSFAIWDEARGQLFCARDHFGMKAFYYHITDARTLVTGLTIAQVLQQPGVRRTLNEQMLQLYLSFTYPAGEDTFFGGVKKLMPGCCMVWKDGRLRITRYFRPEFIPDERKSLEEWAAQIHDTAAAIMRQERRNGEKAGVFLSSGVDSSYILALSDVQESCSCGYTAQDFDEAALAKEAARLLRRRNHTCLITPQAYFGMTPYVMYHMEQPLADASAVAFAIACREAAGRRKVWYSGEGADEFFAGYNIYSRAHAYAEKPQARYIGNTDIMREAEKRELLRRYDPDVLPGAVVESVCRATRCPDALSRMQSVDIQIWLEGDIYLNIDKMSRAAGLEIRMPLSDLRLFSVASRIPARYRAGGAVNKLAFRAAAAKVLPPEIANRKKLGFAVPIRQWLLQEEYNADVRRLFASAAAQRFFHREKLEALFCGFCSGRQQDWRKIWTIYTFLVWYELYFCGAQAPDAAFPTGGTASGDGGYRCAAR